MSDGSLSQSEIDALLGLGGGDSGGGSGGGGAADNSINELKKTIGDLCPALAENLGSMVSKQVTLENPQVSVVSAEQFREGMPDELVELGVDFQEAVSGKHSYIMPPDLATSVAGFMMGMEGVELDEGAIEAVTEAGNTIAGAAATVLGDKAGGTIMTAPGSGQKVTTADYSFTDGDFVKVEYDITLEGGEPGKMYELFDKTMVDQIFSQAAAPAGGGLGGQSAMAPPNVRDVQLPGLNPQSGAGAQGNISLLMDVTMEMSVELGRTRRLVKEILGMGEGTIIELDKLAGEPVDILVNHKPIAKGEVVVIDENFGVRVTEILSQVEGLTSNSN